MAEDTFQKLASCDTLSELKEILSGTAYKEILDQPSEPHLTEKLECQLLSKEIAGYSNIIKYLKSGLKEFVTILLERLEIENLKSILRIWHGKEISEHIIKEKIVWQIPVNDIIKAENFDIIILLLKHTPYSRTLEESKKFLQTKNSLFLTETKLDIEHYRRLWEQVKLLGSRDREIAYKLFGLEIDIKNLEMIYRFKKYYKIPPAEIFNLLIPLKKGVSETLRESIHSNYKLQEIFKLSDNKSLLELAALLSEVKEEEKIFLLTKMLEELLIKEARSILRGFPFSIGTLLSFFVLKRIEITNIKKILRGKLLNLTPAELKENILPIRS